MGISMKKMGIIAAMEQEMSAVKEKMADITEKTIYEKTFFIGTLSGCPCVLVECGIGKVHAARSAQLMIDHFSPACLINVGTAGALNYELDYLDLIISTSCIQFDFDLTVFGRKRGEIPGVGRYLKADARLIELLKAAIQRTDPDHRIVEGIIGTGDQFINDRSVKQSLHHRFQAQCDEMEGGAIAQVCTLCQIPFVVIRSITDKPDQPEQVDFYHYLERASTRCAEFLSIAAKDFPFI